MASAHKLLFLANCCLGSDCHDLWGGHEASFRAALGQVRASEVEAQAARLDLAHAIGQAYVRLALAFEQLEISRELLRQKQEILALSAKLVGAGLITGIDTLSLGLIHALGGGFAPQSQPPALFPRS